jgi:hypothetical protein
MQTESKLLRVFKTFWQIFKREFKIFVVLVLFLSLIKTINTIFSLKGVGIFLDLTITIIVALSLFSISLDVVSGVFRTKESLVKVFNYKLILRFVAICLLLFSLPGAILYISSMSVFLSMFAADSGPNIIATSMLYGGMIFLIIGFVLTITITPRLLFSLFYIVEKNTATIKDSFKISWELSKGNYWQIITLFCITLVFNYLLGTYLKPASGPLEILVGSTLSIIELLLFTILYRIVSSDLDVNKPILV